MSAMMSGFWKVEEEGAEDMVQWQVSKESYEARLGE